MYACAHVLYYCCVLMAVDNTVHGYFTHFVMFISVNKYIYLHLYMVHTGT